MEQPIDDGLAKELGGWFETLFSASPMPQLITDPESGLVLEANPAFWRALGYPAERLKGQSISVQSLLTDPAHGLQPADTAGEAVKVGFRTQTGRVCWLLLVSSPLEYCANRALLSAGVALPSNEPAQPSRAAAIETDTTATWAWDAASGEIQLNHWAAELLCLSGEGPHSLSIQALEDLCHPLDAPNIHAAIHAYCAGELLYLDLEARIIHPDGDWVVLQAQGDALEWAAPGKPARLSGKLAAASPRASVAPPIGPEKFSDQFLIEALRHGVFLFDSSCNLIGANSVASALFARVMAEIDDPNDLWEKIAFVHEDGSPILPEQLPWKVTRRTGQPITAQLVGLYSLSEDDPQKWLSLTTVPVWSDNGRDVTQVYVIAADVTARIKEQKQLRDIEERFRLITEAIDEVFWISEPQRFNEMHYVSPGFTRVWGRTEASLYANPASMWNDILPEDRESVVDALENQLQGHSFNHEFRIYHWDGSVHYLWDRGYPIHDANGSLVRYVGITQDITARKLTELNLRASEEKFRTLINSLDTNIFIQDGDGRFLYLNERAAQLLGKPASTLIGKTVSDVFTEQLAVMELDFIREVIQKDHPAVYEQKLVLTGQERWYRTSLQPIHDSSGNAVSVLNNTSDIHSLKLAQRSLIELNNSLEQRIRERTAEVRDLYDHAPCGYHSLDRRAVYTMVNQTELNWLGYAADDLLGKPIIKFLSIASKVQFEAYYPAFLAGSWTGDLELEFICRNGSLLPVLMSASLVLDESGRFAGCRSTLIDMTARKQIEETLHRSETLYRLLAENVSDVIWILDVDRGYFRYVSSSAERLLGYTADDLIAQEFQSLLTPTTRYKFAEKMPARIQAYQTGHLRYFSDLMELHCRYGETVWTEATCRFMSGENGHLEIYGVSRNITDRKQAEEAMQLANRELQRTLRMKNEFLANMSHELRTPLNAVIGISESLAAQTAGPLNEKQGRYVRVIHESGQHLLDLINDILDLAKVDAGKVALTLEAVNLDEICQASLRMIRELAAKKKLAVVYQIDAHLGLVRVDERRLKQMVVNLLSNAVKFTNPNGRIGLEARADLEEEIFELTVWDTGIGIPAEDLPWLFTPFTQLDGGLDRLQGGTGLGLALVSQMARLHGGSVGVVSEPGLGSRFTLTLPWDPALTAVGPAAALVPQRVVREPQKTILYIEDTESAVLLVGDCLEAAGYRFITANNGIRGIQLAQQENPDLILMDLQMPEMNGFEATQILRANSSFNQTPILALTALAMPGDAERCYEAGMNGCIVKPVVLKELLNLIDLRLYQSGRENE